MTRFEKVLEERAALVKAVREANAAIYGVGAPLGSPAYFEVREILIGALRDVGEV